MTQSERMKQRLVADAISLLMYELNEYHSRSATRVGHRGGKCASGLGIEAQASALTNSAR